MKKETKTKVKLEKPDPLKRETKQAYVEAYCPGSQYIIEGAGRSGNLFHRRD